MLRSARSKFTFMILVVLLLSGCTDQENINDSLPRVGVAIYKFSDTYMSSMRSSMTLLGEGKLSLYFIDGQNAQTKQNEAVNELIAKRYAAIAINPVERTSIAPLIEKAKEANIPLVFINREPLADDLYRWDKVYFVGARAEDSGTMQGEIVADYWKKNFSADKNGDGVLQYVLLKGEPGHQDAELRTKYSILAIEEAGIKTQALVVDTAMWDKLKGQEKMASFLEQYGDKIEFVLANNDDMALGAIEALKEVGYFKNDLFMPVVGVDALEPGMSALKEGTLLGTVLNDAYNQSKATIDLLELLANGQSPSAENFNYELTDGKYVWIPYQKFTQ